jgi:hypothetical protein
MAEKFTVVKSNWRSKVWFNLSTLALKIGTDKSFLFQFAMKRLLKHKKGIKYK